MVTVGADPDALNLRSPTRKSSTPSSVRRTSPTSERRASHLSHSHSPSERRGGSPGKVVSPGPGLLDHRYKKEKGRFEDPMSIYSKARKDTGPGPAAYNPDARILAKHPNIPAFGFSLLNRPSAVINNHPGPGTYNLPPCFGSRSGSPSTSPSRQISRSLSPGPAAENAGRSSCLKCAESAELEKRRGDGLDNVVITSILAVFIEWVYDKLLNDVSPEASSSAKVVVVVVSIDNVCLSVCLHICAKARAATCQACDLTGHRALECPGQPLSKPCLL
jgi:hypothetical protein